MSIDFLKRELVSFHIEGVFLSSIMKNVFQKLTLYRRYGGNTSLASDWLKVFLKMCDIVLKIPESCGKSIHNASEVRLIKKKTLYNTRF